jgi:hypothetical protein
MRTASTGGSFGSFARHRSYRVLAVGIGYSCLLICCTRASMHDNSLPSRAGDETPCNTSASGGMDFAEALTLLPDVHVYDTQSVDLRPYFLLACAAQQASDDELDMCIISFWAYWQGRFGPFRDEEARMRVAVLARLVYAFPDQPNDPTAQREQLFPNGGAPWITPPELLVGGQVPVSIPVVWDRSGPRLVGESPRGWGWGGSPPDPLQQWRLARSSLPRRTAEQGCVQCTGDEFAIGLFEYLGDHARGEAVQESDQ